MADRTTHRRNAARNAARTEKAERNAAALDAALTNLDALSDLDNGHAAGRRNLRNARHAFLLPTPESEAFRCCFE